MISYILLRITKMWASSWTIFLYHPLSIRDTLPLTKSVEGWSSGVSFLGKNSGIPQSRLRIRWPIIICNRESLVFINRCVGVFGILEALVIGIIIMILFNGVLRFPIWAPFYFQRSIRGPAVIRHCIHWGFCEFRAGDGERVELSLACDFSSPWA